GDVLDVHLGVGEGLEHALRDAGVRAHADAHDADFREVRVIGRAGGGAQVVGEALDDRLDVREVAVLDGEADVGRVVVHHVLDDVIDHDVGVGDGREDLRGDAGAVGDALDG